MLLTREFYHGMSMLVEGLRFSVGIKHDLIRKALSGGVTAA